MGKILAVLFLFILFLPEPALTQSVSNELYETEEDLKEGLENGDLTYDEYLELLDLIRSKVKIDSYEAERLLFIPDVTSIEPTQPSRLKTRTLTPLNKSTPFVKITPERKAELKGEMIWQTYQKIEETEKFENFAVLRVQDKKRFNFNLRVQQDESRRLETQKRSLRVLNLWRLTNVVLGNFEKRTGLGLNLGYHPLFRYGLDDSLNIKDSFLYPIGGRYNGILLESKFRFFRPGLIVSQNRFGDLKDQLYALDLNFVHKRSKFGILLTRAELKNSSNRNSFRDDCGSIYFDLFWKNSRLTSEYARMWNDEKGFASNFNVRTGSYRISAYIWWYSSGFVHPHGGGVSNPDYESMYLLDDIDFSYRTRQKGERGILLKSAYRFSPKMFFDFALNQWKKNPASNESLKFKTGGGYCLGENLLTELHLQWSDDLQLSGTDYFSISWDWVYSLLDETYLRLRTNYRKRKLATRTKEYGDVQIRIGDFEVYPFNLNLWLRYTDPDFSYPGNSYWNLNFEEKLYFLKSSSISIKYLAYFYEPKEKNDNHAVRIRWEMEW